ncbi:MAG: hypothetical protein ACUVQ0_05705 [Thermoproteota archaeon]
MIHRGELVGFIKKKYGSAGLVEVILIHELSEQIDLKALKEALSRVLGRRKEPPPEARELMDSDSLTVSMALSNSVEPVFVKPVMKVLIPSELLKMVPGTDYIFESETNVKDLTLSIEDRLAGIPGLAGEWFAGKVDGIIIRNRRRRAVEVPVKTGMMQTPMVDTSGFLTVFDFNTGFKTFKTIVEADIPLIHGDVLLLEGALDERKLTIMAKLLFIIRSREMWILG